MRTVGLRVLAAVAASAMALASPALQAARSLPPEIRIADLFGGGGRGRRAARSRGAVAYNGGGTSGVAAAKRQATTRRNIRKRSPH